MIWAVRGMEWEDYMEEKSSLTPFLLILNNPLKYIDPLGLWPWGLPGKGDAIKNGPSWVDYYLPGLSDSQKTDLVNQVVDEIGWGDVTSGSGK